MNVLSRLDKSDHISVYDVGGRTVAVQPGTQMVLAMFACVTADEKTPGGSLKGDHAEGGAARGSGCSGDGCSIDAQPAASATTAAIHSVRLRSTPRMVSAPTAEASSSHES